MAKKAAKRKTTTRRTAKRKTANRKTAAKRQRISPGAMPDSSGATREVGSRSPMTSAAHRRLIRRTKAKRRVKSGQGDKGDR